MKKVLISLLFCMILISSKSFAGSIPEDLLHSDEAHIFFGEVVAYNADKDIEVFITEKIKGPITERTGRIYYNPNTVGDFKVKEGKKYLFTYFDKNNPTDIFEVTSYDTSTLKLKNVEGDMWERFEKYLNQGRYLDAEHARIDSVNDKILAEGEDISFIELLGVNNENAQSVEISYKGNVFKPNIYEFYKAVEDIKLRNIEDVGLNPETGMIPQEALDGMYITVNGMEGFLFITDDCKVDKYCMAMSRMPMGDYTIKFEEYVRIRNFTITDEEKAELPFLETEQARNLFLCVSLFIILGIGVIALIYGIIKKKKVFVVVGIIPICWLVLGIVDFSLVHNYKKPVFCIGVNTADDGGSGTYKGLGYSFELEGNFMPEAENPGLTSYKGYIFGKEVSRGFWEKQVWDEEYSDAEKYYDYFYENNQIVTLLENENGENFSDDDMAAFAALSLKNPDIENGNKKEEYDEITEKYFGKKIQKFNNSKTYIVPETGLIKPTGWSFDSTVYMSLINLTENLDGTKTADFYAINVSDGFWEYPPQKTKDEVKEEILNNKFDDYGTRIPKVRIKFEEKTDENNNMYIKYLYLEDISI